MLEDRINELMSELEDLSRKSEEAKSEKSSDIRYYALNSKKRQIREQSWTLLHLLARVQSTLNVDDESSSIPLVDYSCNFEWMDHISDEGLVRGNKTTDYKEVVIWFLSGNKEHISRTKDRIKCGGYFTVLDVLIQDYKKPSYIAQMNKAEKRVKELCLFDKQGYSTDLNRLLNSYSCMYHDKNGYNGFHYEDMIQFLRDLLNGIYREEVLKETKDLVRKHPKIIEQLRSVDLG
jgi:hypothetical protein